MLMETTIFNLSQAADDYKNRITEACVDKSAMHSLRDIERYCVSDFVAGANWHEEQRKQSPYYPFMSEAEWINYNNKQLDLFCNTVINYNGSGKFGSDKFQMIADSFKLKNEIAGFIETIKAAKQNAIEREETTGEHYEAGRVEAFEYCLEMLSKHTVKENGAREIVVELGFNVPPTE